MQGIYERSEETLGTKREREKGGERERAPTCEGIWYWLILDQEVRKVMEGWAKVFLPYTTIFISTSTLYLHLTGISSIWISLWPIFHQCIIFNMTKIIEKHPKRKIKKFDMHYHQCYFHSARYSTLPQSCCHRYKSVSGHNAERRSQQRVVLSWLDGHYLVLPGWSVRRSAAKLVLRHCRAGVCSAVLLVTGSVVDDANDWCFVLRSY